MTRSFDIFFDLRLNKRLSKQSWSWWFETLSRPLWRHRNGDIVSFTKSPARITTAQPQWKFQLSFQFAMCYYCIWWIKAHNEYQPHIAYNKMMYACFFLDPPNDIMKKRLTRAFSLSGHHIHSWQTSVTDLPQPDHEIQLFCAFNDTQSLFYKRQQIKISIGNLPHKFPDSIVGWADVGPTSGRLYGRWTNAGPTYIII